MDKNLKNLQSIAYLNGYIKGFNEGFNEGYGNGVTDTIAQIKRAAHELFYNEGKNYGMNFIRHEKSKYPHI
jgi:hypothetical protein